VRVIYFYVTAAAQIRLLAIYKKGVKDDSSADEKKGPEETQRKLLGSTMDKSNRPPNAAFVAADHRDLAPLLAFARSGGS
jgi:hypothetical protein